MAIPLRVSVIEDGLGQAVVIPPEFRFSVDEVYIARDPQTGDLILSANPPQPSVPPKVNWNEIFRKLDEAGSADFELERDLSPPEERDWLDS